MRITYLIATASLFFAPILAGAESNKLRRIETNKASLEKLLKQNISLPAHMSANSKAGVRQVAIQINKGNLKAAQRKWAGVVKSLPRTSIEKDVNALVQWVMRETYKGQIADLRYFAEKVQYFNDLKKELREEIARMRNLRANYPNGPSGGNKKAVVLKFDGNIPRS